MLNSILGEFGIAGKDEPKDKLCEELQYTLNKDSRELFLVGEMKLFVALDDDKVRFQLRVRVRHCWPIPIDYNGRYLKQECEPAKTLCVSYKGNIELPYWCPLSCTLSSSQCS